MKNLTKISKKNIRKSRDELKIFDVTSFMDDPNKEEYGNEKCVNKQYFYGALRFTIFQLKS